MKKLLRTALTITLLLAASALRHSPAAAAPDNPPQAEGSSEELEEFVPTEKLPADSAISFPVDI